MIWTERGDVQAMENPKAYNQDWLGYLIFSALPSTLRYHESNLHLDNTLSETKIIKTSFTLSKLH